MTTHVCFAVELLTREIREEGGDGKIGGVRGGGSRRRRRTGACRGAVRSGGVEM